jgi:hypothetical protein
MRVSPDTYITIEDHVKLIKRTFMLGFILTEDDVHSRIFSRGKHADSTVVLVCVEDPNTQTDVFLVMLYRNKDHYVFDAREFKDRSKAERAMDSLAEMVH